MTCDKCKFANWKRTSNGRLHPDGTGRCTYAARHAVPASTPSWGMNLDHDRMMVVQGGHISRGHDWSGPCALYEATP